MKHTEGTYSETSKLHNEDINCTVNKCTVVHCAVYYYMYLLYASQNSTIHDYHFQVFYTHLYGTLLTVNLTANHMTF